VLPGFLLLGLAHRPVFDLDAPVPIGAPADWARMIPVLTPAFPSIRTKSKPTASAPAGETAVDAREKTRAFDSKLLGPANLSQIVTVDIVNHIPWTNPAGRLPGVQPMHAVDSKNPQAQAERFYWLGVVPLLRVWFHPETVSRTEAIAHVVELGEVAWPALQLAGSEGALKYSCDQARKLIGVPVSTPSKPLEGSSLYEQMMFKFVEHELTRAFPYDPAGGFAKRLEWLGDEMVPFIAAYTNNENQFLRRNAVAALALFRQRGIPDRWMSLAGNSNDPVVRFRALALLSRSAYENVNIAPLCELLEKSRDEIEATRLVRTLGDMRDPAAVPAILTFAKRFENSSDAILAALGSIERIGSQGTQQKALLWVVGIRKELAGGKSKWRPAQPPPGYEIDRPDVEGYRHSVLTQLAICAWARLNPMDPEARAELLQLLTPAAADPGPNGAAEPAVRYSLRRVAPIAQVEFVEALAFQAPEGTDALQSIANDRAADRTIRNYALRLLPASRRQEVARNWALVGNESAGLTAAAVELLDTTNDEKATEAALRYLELRSFGTRRIRGPQERAAVVIALRSLMAREAVPKEQLSRFVDSLVPSLSPETPAREDLRNRIQRLVEAAAAGASELFVFDRAAELVAFVYDRRGEFNLPESWKGDALKQVTAQLGPPRAKRNDAKVREAAIDAIFAYLWPLVAFEPVPRAQGDDDNIPLEEIAIFAAARTRDKAILQKLCDHLGRDDYPYRAVTCLALGTTRDKKVGKAMLHCLTDEDAYTRLCAYRALKQITGKDFFVDYLYGNSLNWVQAVHEYQKAL
jgi:hypothetical protein